jgi:glycosyltransferase involved in cell wall biosynthesis
MSDVIGKHIVATVTNDLTTDQRMHRICSTMVKAGYKVTLIGRELRDSLPLNPKPYHQIRLRCQVNKGPIFYLEYNIRLWRYMSTLGPDLINPVDLDTILAASWMASKRQVPFVFDAHEYFTEVPELSGAPVKKWLWTQIGKRTIPKAVAAYTVNTSLADILGEKYGVLFHVIRNLPFKDEEPKIENNEKRLIYQGVLNKGRCIEDYIDMMECLDPQISLHIYGEGDLSIALRARANRSIARDRIIFHGKLRPEALRKETRKAWIGLNLLEGDSLNYTYSLANKFFDYLNAGIPSINSPLPEYERIVEAYGVGMIVPKDRIPSVIHRLLKSPEEYQSLLKNIIKARGHFTWEEESKTLIKIYKGVFDL